MRVIDKITPYKTKRVKGNTQKWLYAEKLNSRDKLFQEFKKCRLHIDKEEYEALKLIATKKQAFSKIKSQKILVNPKSYRNPLNI